MRTVHVYSIETRAATARREVGAATTLLQENRDGPLRGDIVGTLQRVYGILTSIESDAREIQATLRNLTD